MKVLIIEDEALAVKQLLHMLRNYDPSVEIVGTLDSVEASVAWFRAHPPPDLLLADIELVDGQSFRIFEQVPVQCPVIFTTAYDEYALRAFQVHSVDYLLKPIQEEVLHKSLRKLGEMKQLYGKGDAGIDLKALGALLRGGLPPAGTYRDRFLLKQGARLIPVEVREVAYFFTRDRLTFAKTWDGRSLAMDYTLDELEQLLDPKLFYRVNRQFILCPKAVEKIHLHFNYRLKVDLKPAAEEEVFISRDKATEFRAWMGE
jgi:two-component system LytT family response regulator